MIQTANMESPTRRISIEEKYLQHFWQVVMVLANNKLMTDGAGNPFESVNLSDIVVDTIITLAGNNQEKIAALQAIAKSDTKEILEKSFTPDSVDVGQKTFLLYINKQKRQPFWDAMIQLGNRVLMNRERTSPFEAVSVSPLIVSTFLGLAGHNVPLNEVVTSRLSMEGSTLNLSITRQKRERFWQNLLTVATSKREGNIGGNPFKAVDRSELVIQLIIDRGKAVADNNQHQKNHLNGSGIHQTHGSIPEVQSFNLKTPMLVLYINEKMRLSFWDAMVTLGNMALTQCGTNNPFEGVTASALITDEIADHLNLLQGNMPEHVEVSVGSDEYSLNEQSIS